MIPTGVRIPVVSMSTLALTGMVQAFTTPGICMALSRPFGPWIRSSVLWWSGQALRSMFFSHSGAQSEYQVGIFGHSDCGFRIITVSIIDRGAGSVAVSARPAFPNTRSTSGKDFRILSCIWSTR